MAEEPIDHVQRAMPPWDDTVKTECGKDEVAGRVLTRDEFAAKVKKEGQQRSALTTCMTCWSTARNYRSWAVSPTEAMSRWLGRGYRDTEHDTELRAIAALIEAHREEYDGYIAGVEQATDLTARRLEVARAKRTDPHTRRI